MSMTPGLSKPLRPFQRQRFEDLPDRPLRPHPYFDATPHEIEMESAGLGPLRVHYRTYGRGERPLLLVHGLMTSGYSWRYVMEELGAHFRLIIPDLPGNGRSGIPAVRMSAAKVAAWIGEFQTALEVRGCPVIANSLGGYLAMRHALADPGAVSGVLNIHSPAFPFPRLHAMHLALSIPGAPALFGRWIRRDTDRWAHRIVHYYDDTAKSREEAREYGGPLDTAEGVRAFTGYLRDVLDPRGFAAFIADLDRNLSTGKPFPVPLRLVYSDRDPLVPPKVGTKLAGLVPGAELIRVGNSSHFVQVDRPDVVVASALDFLGVLPSRKGC